MTNEFKLDYDIFLQVFPIAAAVIAMCVALYVRRLAKKIEEKDRPAAD